MAATEGLTGKLPVTTPTPVAAPGAANTDGAKADKGNTGSVAKTFEKTTVEAGGGTATAAPTTVEPAKSAVAARQLAFAKAGFFTLEDIREVVRSNKDIADLVTLKDEKLNKVLREQMIDAQTLAKSLPTRNAKIAVLGTARSSDKPSPKDGKLNGVEDFMWCIRVGFEAGRRQMAMGTGGGHGAMIAALEGVHNYVDLVNRGLAEYDTAVLAEKLSKLANPGDMDGQGDNIILPFEQLANELAKDLASFEHFLFRMEALFRNSVAQIQTPGGFGTIAESFTGISLRKHHDIDDPVIFGAPDDYWKDILAAFGTMLSADDNAMLANVMDGEKAIIDFIANSKRVANEIDIEELVTRELFDLAQGLIQLDGAPEATTFLAGNGDTTKQSAGIFEGIASGLADDGQTLRVTGSATADAAVRKGAGNDIQAFSLLEGGCKGPSYTRVHDLLVLRELSTTNCKALVVTPDSVETIAMLFVAACDIQTKEMPKIPIVVVDPEGKFAEVRKVLKQTLLSQNADGSPVPKYTDKDGNPKRRYINPEDVFIFTPVKTAEEALAVLRGKAKPETAL